MIRRIPRIFAVGVLTSYIFVLGACFTERENMNTVDAHVRIEKADVVTTESAVDICTIKEKQTIKEKKKVHQMKDKHMKIT